MRQFYLTWAISQTPSAELPNRLKTSAKKNAQTASAPLRWSELADSLPLPWSAYVRLLSGELMERFHEAALEILGMRATLSQGAAGNLLNGRFEQGLRHSLMWVISIGTNQIGRSLIAQRGLGLPR